MPGGVAGVPPTMEAPYADAQQGAAQLRAQVPQQAHQRETGLMTLKHSDLL